MNKLFKIIVVALPLALAGCADWRVFYADCKSSEITVDVNAGGLGQIIHYSHKYEGIPAHEEAKTTNQDKSISVPK